MKVIKTKAFRLWLENLRDGLAQTKIAARIERLEEGLFGDTRSLGGGLNELKINYGPGYRVYFCRKGDLIVILLCGGDKSSQGRGIKQASEMMRTLKD